LAGRPCHQWHSRIGVPSPAEIPSCGVSTGQWLLLTVSSVSCIKTFLAVVDWNIRGYSKTFSGALCTWCFVGLSVCIFGLCDCVCVCVQIRTYLTYLCSDLVRYVSVLQWIFFWFFSFASFVTDTVIFELITYVLLGSLGDETYTQ